MRIISLIAISVLCCGAIAAEPPPWPRLPQDRVELDRFARARFAEVQQLLSGPSQPRAQASPALDCRALYQQRMALMRQQLDYRPSLWDDPRGQAGVLIAAIWSPALYYLPYRAVSNFQHAAHAPQITAEIDQLRAVSAGLRCFER